jgi:hypothetical protein
MEHIPQISQLLNVMRLCSPPMNSRIGEGLESRGIKPMEIILVLTAISWKPLSEGGI